jgi:carboxylesterase
MDISPVSKRLAILMSSSVNDRAANKKEFTEKLKGISLPPGVKVGALLLHGLTGMPNEMRSLEKALKPLGCDVAVPMLAGHGEGSKALLKTGWKDWVDGARQALNELSQRCDQVYVGGLSMGGLIPVILAVENPKVCGIASLSPTIKYDAKNSSNPFQVLIPLIDIMPFLGTTFYWIERPPYGLKDERLVRLITKGIEDAKTNKGGDANPDFDMSQFRTYSASLRQMQLLVGQVKKEAPKVTCPVLIMQSLEDTITTVANAETLNTWLSAATDKQIIYLEGCDHVLTADLKKEEVAYNFAAFVCRVAATRAAGT